MGNRLVKEEPMNELYIPLDQYTIVILKAISGVEAPVKQNHIRTLIIGTFQDQGSELFWRFVNAKGLPYTGDIIGAWKFCYVLHKILREGHPHCVVDSMKYRHLLEHICKLWGHMDGYGKLIKQYTILLNTKLEFHNRNPKLPSNLDLTTEELSSICGGNADICFQLLSVDIFDYLDCILDLQKSIYSLQTSSMTMQGQCRLAAIIPCIQDASRLYDHNVQILCTLHSMVDYDALEGHRERFDRQYKIMKRFYDQTNNLQYFKNLISIPSLAEPPNFKSHSNVNVTFNTYSSSSRELYVPQEVKVVKQATNLNDFSRIQTFQSLDVPSATSPPVVVHPVSSIRSIPPKATSIVTENSPPLIDKGAEGETDDIIKRLHKNIALLTSELRSLNDEK